MVYSNSVSRTFRLIIVGFNLFTIALYATAPLDYSSSANFVLSIIYLLVSCALINYGFKAGEKKSFNPVNLEKKLFFKTTEKILNFVFIFYTLTFLIKYAYHLRFSPLDVRGMFSFLSLGIADPYWAYHTAISDTRPWTVSWSIYFIISLVDQIFFIFAFLTYDKQKKYQKILLAFFVTLELFYWVGRATNFGVVALVLGFFVTRIVNAGGDSKFNIKKLLRLLLLGFLLFVIALFSFGSTMDSRTGGADATGAFTMTKGGIFDILPEQFWSSYYYVVSYLCQGYYNMSLAFDIPHGDWTFFLGNNPALISLSNFLFGTDLMEHSYMKSLDLHCGVDEFAAWHSAYLWWANDFTIFGALIIVYILAYITGYSLRLSNIHNDLLSKIICTVSSCMLIMLFANNTYLSNVFYSCMILFPIWYFTRFRQQ